MSTNTSKCKHCGSEIPASRGLGGNWHLVLYCGETCQREARTKRRRTVRELPKGIYYNTRGTRFQVNVTVPGRGTVYLGSFETVEEAQVGLDNRVAELARRGVETHEEYVAPPPLPPITPEHRAYIEGLFVGARVEL